MKIVSSFSLDLELLDLALKHISVLTGLKKDVNRNDVNLFIGLDLLSHLTSILLNYKVTLGSKVVQCHDLLQAKNKLVVTTCVILSNILCEADSDSLDLAFLEKAVKPLFFTEECPKILKLELLTVFCNSIRNTNAVSRKLLVYLLDQCDLVPMVCEGLKIAEQNQQ